MRTQFRNVYTTVQELLGEALIINLLSLNLNLLAKVNLIQDKFLTRPPTLLTLYIGRAHDDVYICKLSQV